MYDLSIILFAIVLLISKTTMAFPSIYQMDDDQMNSMSDADMRRLLKQPTEVNPWVYKRNSLCDYRLQFRPLPLTPALCAYSQ